MYEPKGRRTSPHEMVYHIEQRDGVWHVTASCWGTVETRTGHNRAKVKYNAFTAWWQTIERLMERGWQ